MRFTDKIAEHGLLLGTPSESYESTPSYSLALAPHKDEDVKPVLAFANRQTQFTRYVFCCFDASCAQMIITNSIICQSTEALRY